MSRIIILLCVALVALGYLISNNIDMQEDLLGLQAENSRLQVELDQLRSNIIGLEENNTQLQSEMNQMRANLNQCSTEMANLVEENAGLQNHVNELEALLSTVPQAPQDSPTQANQVRLSLMPIRENESIREENNNSWIIILVLIAVGVGTIIGMLLAVIAYKREQKRRANTFPRIYQNRLIG